jgi:hypothetical protein
MRLTGRFALQTTEPRFDGSAGSPQASRGTPEEGEAQKGTFLRNEPNACGSKLRVDLIGR